LHDRLFFEFFSRSLAAQALRAILGKRGEKFGITIGRVTELAEYQPGFKIKAIEYKQHFRSTIIEEIPPTDKAQAYLKRMR